MHFFVLGVEDALKHTVELLHLCRRLQIPIIHTNVEFMPHGLDGGIFRRKIPLLEIFNKGKLSVYAGEEFYLSLSLYLYPYIYIYIYISIYCCLDLVVVFGKHHPFIYSSVLSTDYTQLVMLHLLFSILNLFVFERFKVWSMARCIATFGKRNYNYKTLCFLFLRDPLKLDTCSYAN